MRRRVRVIASAPPLLASWMENHPWEDDHDAPLWIMIGVRNKHSNMSYAASMMLRRLARTCFAA